MSKQKYYAVKVGRTTGIYHTWDECKEQVEKYPGAKFQSFSTAEDASKYLEGDIASEKPEREKENKEDNSAIPYAFVDGSYNPETKIYGYGGFLEASGHRYPLMGSGCDPEMASMRNVAGEIEGSMAAVRKAEELGIEEVRLLYDYRGIEDWATGSWKTNKKGTLAYREFMNSSNRIVRVIFEKVEAHTGIVGNEMADVMAKNAVGIALTPSQQKLLDKVLKQRN